MAHHQGREVPRGVVTFLFTDVEGSTKMWERDENSMRSALQSHDEILRNNIGAESGFVFSTAGDAFAAAFESPEQAARAAGGAQNDLQATAWPESAPIKVRMGIHTGEAQQRDEDYFGPALNRAARLMSAAHGGQTVLSSATKALAEGLRLIDMGEHRLKDLARPERVWQLVVDGLASDFPPLRTLDAVPTNLPLELSSFVGREDELAEVMSELEHNRLVTLTGVGGVGKTRLALQVAADASHHYPDGLWLIALAPVKVSDAVPFRLLEALAIEAEPSRSPLATAATAIGDNRVLLIIDNCEHVIGAASSMIATLLAHCSNMKVLASSRLGLEIGGERIRQIQPLSTGSMSEPATRLFIDRALAAGADASLVDRSDVIAQICERVDGVPLAIELAAARIRSMTPEDLAERLAERVNVLKQRGSEERHQTLKNTIDWSYQLLNDEQRLLFERLAVFAGSFTLEAAEQICSDEDLDAFDVVDLLDDLVRHSLVVADLSRKTARYRMLETIREFAAERLDEDLPRLRDAHARYHEQWAASISKQQRTRDEAASLERLEAGWSDLRAAAVHALGDLDLLANLLSSLALDGVFRTRLEIADWATTALEVAEDQPVSVSTRVALLATAAAFLGLAGQPERAVEVASELVELCESTNTPITVEAGAATIAGVLLSGDVSLANRSQELMEQAASESTDPWEVGMTSVFRAITSTYSGEPERAREASRQAASKLPADLAPSCRALAGWMAAVTSDEPRTRVVERMERVVEQATLLRSSFLRSIFTQYLASVRSEVGDLSRSMLDAADNIGEMLAAKSHGLATATARRAAALLMSSGAHSAGATVLAWVDSRDSIPPTADLAAQLDTLIPAMEAQLSPDDLDAARRAGGDMSLEEVMEFAADALRSAAGEAALEG